MTLLKTFIILILFKSVFGHHNSYNINKKPLAAECINTIVSKSFPCGTSISVLFTKGVDINSVLTELGKDNCYSYIVRKYTNHNWLIPTNLYILTATNAERFSKGVARLSNDIFWDPKSPVIIELEEQNDGDIIKVFDVLLRYNIFHGIFIQRSNNVTVTLYTYFPFKGSNCGLRYEYSNISDCDPVKNIKYFSKKPISLKNCNVTIVANEDTSNFIYDQELEEEGFTENNKQVRGLEQFLLDTIAEKEGIKIYFKYVKKDLTLGVVLPNNTATGLLNYLQKDEVDIAAGGIILIKNRMDMFEYIWGYNYAVFNLYTPAMGEEIWRDVYKEFSLKTWILIALAYSTITVVSMTLIKRLKSQSLRNRGYLSLKLWGYLYVNTSGPLSREVKMRRFMVFWIWFTFFICNFYNTALYSLLTSRDQMKLQISVDNLHNIPFKPCVSQATLTYFQFAMNKTLPSSEGIPECMYSDTSLDYVADSNNAYAIELDDIYKLRERRYLDDDGHPKLDAWTFSTSNIIAMYLTRGFPRTRQFQEHAWRLYETGILKKHLKALHHNMNYKIDLHKRHFKKILLTDLRIHFLILITGWTLSLLCFLIELLVFRNT